MTAAGTVANDAEWCRDMAAQALTGRIGDWWLLDPVERGTIADRFLRIADALEQYYNHTPNHPRTP